MAKKPDTDTTAEITLATLPPKLNETPRTSYKPEGEILCFGVFRVKNSTSAGGLWVIRKIVTDGERIVSYEDSEPDVLDIQMGKIDRYIDSSTER